MSDNDKRMVCKYGTKCYQKNPVHHQKYKHPPKKPIRLNKEQDSEQQIHKKIKLDDSLLEKNSKENEGVNPIIKISNDISDSDSDSPTETSKPERSPKNLSPREGEIPEEITNNELELKFSPKLNDDNSQKVTKKIIPKDIDPKKFIEEKFLVKMPDDFYDFWKLCTKLNSSNPELAFKEVDLTLVGPYDVLAGKFCNIEDKDEDEYLIHWRYYYDTPEVQTVLKGSDSKGYHIGYFRDDPSEDPVFLVSNYAQVDGTFEVMGSHIFTAVSIYLGNFLKKCNPFQKVKVDKLQTAIKNEAKVLGIDLIKVTDKMRERNRKVVAKGFYKIGIVVPYNKKTQLGYRELSLDNADLRNLLYKIKEASEEQRHKFIADLQPVLTYATLAIDECDFGTGIELGLNIHFCGVDCLDKNVSMRFLQNSYKLLQRNVFAKIAGAHLSSRKKGCNLSII